MDLVEQLVQRKMQKKLASAKKVTDVDE